MIRWNICGKTIHMIAWWIEWFEELNNDIIDMVANAGSWLLSFIGDIGGVCLNMVYTLRIAIPLGKMMKDGMGYRAIRLRQIWLASYNYLKHGVWMIYYVNIGINNSPLLDWWLGGHFSRIFVDVTCIFHMYIYIYIF